MLFSSFPFICLEKRSGWPPKHPTAVTISWGILSCFLNRCWRLTPVLSVCSVLSALRESATLLMDINLYSSSAVLSDTCFLEVCESVQCSCRDNQPVDAFYIFLHSSLAGWVQIKDRRFLVPHSILPELAPSGRQGSGLWQRVWRAMKLAACLRLSSSFAQLGKRIYKIGIDLKLGCTRSR